MYICVHVYLFLEGWHLNTLISMDPDARKTILQSCRRKNESLKIRTKTQSFRVLH